MPEPIFVLFASDFGSLDVPPLMLHTRPPILCDARNTWHTCLAWVNVACVCVCVLCGVHSAGSTSTTTIKLIRFVYRNAFAKELAVWWDPFKLVFSNWTELNWMGMMMKPNIRHSTDRHCWNRGLNCMRLAAVYQSLLGCTSKLKIFRFDSIKFRGAVRKCKHECNAILWSRISIWQRITHQQRGDSDWYAQMHEWMLHFLLLLFCFRLTNKSFSKPSIWFDSKCTFILMPLMCNMQACKCYY